MPLLGSLLKRAIHLRSKIRFKEGDPVRYQEKTLRKLLRLAKDTSFGTRFDFNALYKSHDIIEEFQKNVPVHTYNQMYELWWSRALADHPDICWPGHTRYFALSSGTSEAASKYIPVTREMLKSINKASIKLIFAMANYDLPSSLFEKGILMLGSSTELTVKGSQFVGDMSGISANKMPFWMNRFYKPGKKIAATQDWDEKLNLIAANASKWDIGIICGIPSWIQITLDRIIEQNKLDSIHDIWPNLKIYVHGGISFVPYHSSFKKLFSKPMVYSETYMASEGFFAFKAREDAKGLQLILNNGVFYEFIPFNEENFDELGNPRPGAKAYSIDEVEKEFDYALVISTNSGAWRYLIGDTVRFVDLDYKEILITGRTKHFLSICGEHLSVDNMNKALQMTASHLGVNLQEYTVQGIPFDNLFAHRWYIGTQDPHPPVASIRETLDCYLREVNDDYATERDNVLREIEIHVIPNNLFFEWMKLRGKVGDQSKFPRVLKPELFKEWETFVQSKATEFL